MQLSDVISIFALVISGFTFYWTSLRDRKVLHLIRVDGYSNICEIKFVLLNGGDKSILISSVLVGFDGDDGKRRSYPELERIAGVSDGFALAPGESHLFSYRLSDKTRSDLLENGMPRHEPVNNAKEFPVVVVTEWFDTHAKQHSANAVIMTVGFTENGGTLYSPLVKNHELYRVAS